MHKRYAYNVGESWTTNIVDILNWCEASVKETKRRGKAGVIMAFVALFAITIGMAMA